MRDIGTKTDGVSTLAAAAFNSGQVELENVVTKTGQTLDPGIGPDTDTDMLGKAMAAYAGSGNYFVDSGSGTAYVLAPPGNHKPPPFIVGGLRISFFATNANLGSATAAITGVGSPKILRHKGGKALAAGVIAVGTFVTAVYDAPGGYYELENPSYRGCLAYRLLPAQVLTTGVSADIVFQAEDGDTSSIHSISVNPERVVVPQGVTQIDLVGQVEFDSNGTGIRSVTIEKNGNPGWKGQPTVTVNAVSTQATNIIVISLGIRVVPGDYFTLRAYQTSGGNLGVSGSTGGDETWLRMKLIS